MDVQMPVLDGYNATREIRKHPDPAVRDILVIAMTASAIRGDREKCLEAGMNNYLAKPVRADTLKQMLESYLHQPAKAMPNLQQEANQLVDRVVSGAKTKGEDGSGVANGATTKDDISQGKILPTRQSSGHSSIRSDTPEIHLTPNELAKKVQAQSRMQEQQQLVGRRLQDERSRGNRFLGRSNSGLDESSESPPASRNSSRPSAQRGGPGVERALEEKRKRKAEEDMGEQDSLRRPNSQKSE
jgi:YesN/AraC family two-component response regulator